VDFDGIAVDTTIFIKYVRRGATLETSSHIRRAVALDGTSWLDTLSEDTIITSTSIVMGLKKSAVTIVSEFLIAEVNGISRVGVVLRVLAQNVDYPNTTFVTPVELFTSVTAKLSASVTDGKFDTTLATWATTNGAAELMAAVYDVAEPSVPPTYTVVNSTPEESNNISTDKFVGIVIGVLMAFMLIFGCIWFAIKRRNEDNEQRTKQDMELVGLARSDSFLQVA
jgi:hypothetical protein